MSGKRSLGLRRPKGKEKEIAASTTSGSALIRLRHCVPTDQAPILIVTLSEPEGPSVVFNTFLFMLQPPLKPPTEKMCILNKMGKPCAACGVAQCGGLRKRYTITVEGKKKIFTFCPRTWKSSTAGYDNQEYDDYEHVKKVVNERVNYKEDS